MKKLKFLLIIKRCLGILLIIIGVVSFFLPNIMLTNSTNNKFIELPLSDPKGIVIDEEGNIFCGIPNYSRIQVYNSYGKFLYAIDIDTGGGNFKIKYENGYLYVASIRNDKMYKFNKSGKLISETTNKDAYMLMSGINNVYMDDKSKYELKNPFLIYPYITKSISDNSSITIVRNSFIKWILMQPLPCWIFIIVGLVINIGGISKVKELLKNNSKNWEK